MTALITLASAGLDTGPFNLYSNIDSYLVAFETNVAKSALLSGYTSSLVPNTTATIRVQSASVLCTNYVDMSFAVPDVYTLITSPGGAFKAGNSITCSSVGTDPDVAIYLSDSDLAVWNSNGNLLAANMILRTNSAGDIATYSRVYDPYATTIYNVVSGARGSVYTLC